ncbi:hypothetical protein MXL54_19650 [Enterobacteriaceae bacterium G50]|nr:hypothetical protein [Enterobacteriaceae bacterium G50]
MQSVKLSIGIVAFIFSAGIFAEPTTSLPFPAMPDTKVGTQPSQPMPMPGSKVASQPAQTAQPAPELDKTVSDAKTTQEFLKEVVENDFEYQLKSRQLEQEVELEKMRSEIRKLRGEDKKPVASVAPAQPAAPQPDAPTPKESKIPKELPFVLLESEIAGNARVAVTNNERSKLMYVRPGDRFEMDGVQYQLVRDKSHGLLVKGIEE